MRSLSRPRGRKITVLCANGTGNDTGRGRTTGPEPRLRFEPFHFVSFTVGGDVLVLHHSLRQRLSLGTHPVALRYHPGARAVYSHNNTFSLNLRFDRGKYVLFIGGERLKTDELRRALIVVVRIDGGPLPGAHETSREVSALLVLRHLHPGPCHSQHHTFTRLHFCLICIVHHHYRNDDGGNNKNIFCA